MEVWGGAYYTQEQNINIFLGHVLYSFFCYKILQQKVIDAYYTQLITVFFLNGLVSLFHGISTFVGNLIQKLFF